MKLNETFSKIDNSVNVKSDMYYDNFDNDSKIPPSKILSRNKKNASMRQKHSNYKNKKGNNKSRSSYSTDDNILEAKTHAEACQLLLNDAGATIDKELLPGYTDLSECFSQIEEHIEGGGNDGMGGGQQPFVPPCTSEQQWFFRKNHNLFTSAEDDLVSLASWYNNGRAVLIFPSSRPVGVCRPIVI